MLIGTEMKFWMIWNPAGHAPVFKHFSFERAKAEAERLAEAHPDAEFYVLAAVAKCKRAPVVDWERIGADDIPF